ncbi:MAG: hypothetical protein NT068_04080 [Candidatus Nomurabacteria bacterium]|nr:hypothetical protein [Candidatus Nomurabacteria bacterium]
MEKLKDFKLNTEFKSANNIVLDESTIETISQSRNKGNLSFGCNQLPVELISNKPIGAGGSKEVYEVKINNASYALAIPHAGIDSSNKILEKWQTVLKEPDNTNHLRKMGFYTNDFIQTIPVSINNINFPALIMKRYEDLPFEIRDSKNIHSSIGSSKLISKQPTQEEIVQVMDNIIKEIVALIKHGVILHKDSFNLCVVNGQSHLYFNDLGNTKFETIDQKEYTKYITGYTSFAMNAFLNGLTDEEYVLFESTIETLRLKEEIIKKVLEQFV